MRIGVMVPMSFSDGPGRMPSWREIRDFALHAEAEGLDSVWVCDHFLSKPAGAPVEGIHEGWTILSALAASTSHVALGQLVTCTSFRNPGLLAKMASTADAVSNGRLVLGLGAGWYDAEYEAFGYPIDRRVSRFEEAVEIIGRLLAGEIVSFAGRYHELRDALLLPRPARRIPVLVAGNGPRLLRLAARHADAWNTAWYGRPDERLRGRLRDLDAALAAEGREAASIERTVGIEVADPDATSGDGGFLFRGEVSELAALLDEYDALGIDMVVVGLRPMTARSLERLAAAIERRRAGRSPATRA